MMPLPQATSSFLAAHSRKDASSILSGTVLPLLLSLHLFDLAQFGALRICELIPHDPYCEPGHYSYNHRSP
jgi:hypothetical protein